MAKINFHPDMSKPSLRWIVAVNGTPTDLRNTMGEALTAGRERLLEAAGTSIELHLAHASASPIQAELSPATYLATVRSDGEVIMSRAAVVDEEDVQAGRATVVGRFATVSDAEAWIAQRHQVDPDKVKRGGYGIDGRA